VCWLKSYGIYLGARILRYLHRLNITIFHSQTCNKYSIRTTTFQPPGRWAQQSSIAWLLKQQCSKPHYYLWCCSINQKGSSLSASFYNISCLSALPCPIKSEDLSQPWILGYLSKWPTCFSTDYLPVNITSYFQFHE